MKSSHVGSASSPEHDMEIDTVTRERLLLDTLVELADTLVADFDVVGLLDLLTRRCAQLFSLKGAGAVLVDQHGYLRVMACSTEQIWLTDVLQAQNHDGPLLDSYRSGKANSDGDLEAARSRWPTFAPLAIDAGIRSVFAFPLHLRDALLGALGLFGTETAALSADEARRAKALADVASVGIVQFAVAHDHDPTTMTPWPRGLASRCRTGRSSSKHKGCSPSRIVSNLTRPSLFSDATRKSTISD